ncbi:hypothetical protein DOY81_000672, partial [Sarcophaga bullata]
NFCCSSCKASQERTNSTIFYCLLARDVCPNEDIKFYFYTRETENNPVLLDIANVSADLFPERLPLKILIHGYTLNHDLSPNVELRPLLLHQQNTYVISVDYSPLSRLGCYFWAAQNVRAVGKCLAFLLNNLMDQGVYGPNDIHIIGFSLGGQVAGLTANYLNKKIARITGLDPAGNVFLTASPHDRLDASDADFVDVIHTTTAVFSSTMAMGHADFYPNVLHLVQPGCNLIEVADLCSHYRSNIYYAESITTTVGFWSYNCGSYLEFLFNQCTKYTHIPYVKMGYFVDKSARGSYFLETNAEPPYAKDPFDNVELEVAE